MRLPSVLPPIGPEPEAVLRALIDEQLLGG